MEQRGYIQRVEETAGVLPKLASLIVKCQSYKERIAGSCFYIQSFNFCPLECWIHSHLKLILILLDLHLTLPHLLSIQHMSFFYTSAPCLPPSFVLHRYFLLHHFNFFVASDHWTAWVWTVHVHWYVDIFSIDKFYSSTWSLAGWLCRRGAADTEG